LKGADYSHAFTELQGLVSQSGLTPEQDRTLGSELRTVNQLLQSEQSQGNREAARALQHYQATK
jgi:Trp operon repressor